MNLDPAVVIENKARAVIDCYKQNRERNVHWVSSLTNLTTEAVQEYENRFLIELIQNGYDANPAGTTDGAIYIRFDRNEGPYGTLYVANTGCPFGESQFNAICEIAQSDKTPGVGIGNKGVGFRSVLQICRVPEVYSANPASYQNVRFDGFCFSFATEADYWRLTNEDDELCAAAKRDISPYFLPVYLPKATVDLTAFAHEKMVTVIRLPLDTKPSQLAVETQIDALRSSTVPVLLFLDRIKQLTIKTIGDETIRTDLLREPSSLLAEDVQVKWELVKLHRINRKEQMEESHPVGTFFVASRTVPTDRLKQAITRSILEGQIDPKFASWSADAVVSAAVRIDAENMNNCVYTFLPMAKEASAPFWGHLNAPFVTKLARTTLSTSVHINSLFYDVAADICASTALALRHSTINIPPSAVLDLITWEKSEQTRLLRSFADLNQDICTAELVSILPRPDGRRWAQLRDARRWDKETKIITAERVVKCAHADILDGSVGSRRADRLANFARSLDLDIDPNSSTVAAWAENIATELIGHAFEAATWNDFYDDLAQLFEYEGRLLNGRLLLLDGTLTLRRCGPFSAEQIAKNHPAVFFPPTTERAEDDEEIDRSADVDIPTNVSQFVSYMHRDLVWYRTDDGVQRRTEARDFLQKAGLVLRYGTRTLLDHLSRISQCATDDCLSADILRLAYNLHKAANSPMPAGRSWVFSVPTASGWKSANQATFSAKWPNTEGDNVERLISETHGISTEMDDLRFTLLVSPDSEPFDRTEIDQWVRFLRIVGVKDGLSPCAIAMPKSDFPGWKITTEVLGDSLGLCQSDVFWWQKVTSRNQFSQYPNSPYKVETPFYRLPGQSEHGNFSTSAKRSTHD
jgi:hypothetical protein